MTNMELLQYIGAADDKYILESRQRPKVRKIKWQIALAACAALVVLCGGVFAFKALQRAEPVPSTVETVENTPEASVEETSAPADISAYDVTLLAQAEYPEAISLQDSSKRGQRWTENQVSDATRYALNAFTYSTASKVLQNETGSGCYSPLSLYHALAILASGAEGQTREELLSLLGQSDIETLQEESGKLYRVNASEDEVDFLRICNSLWLDETGKDNRPVAYNEDWVLSTAANYYADVYQAEFAEEETVQALGAWIAEHTGGLLHPTQETLKLSPETVMAIVNTVWYRSHWSEAFDLEATGVENFTTKEGETIPVEFMHQTDYMGSCVRGANYTKASLRLTQGKMIVVLPDEGTDVESLLSEEQLWDIFENGEYESAEVRWSMPKFETDATYDLEEILQSLGVTTAFTEEFADFSPISDMPLYLTRVQQGTHIAVNEDGVEAAAYTLEGMELAGAASEAPPVVEMNLNRPFIYLITANDGSPLFVGVVRNPSN